MHSVFDEVGRGMFNDWQAQVSVGALMKLQSFDSVQYIDEAAPEPTRENDSARANARSGSKPVLIVRLAARLLQPAGA